MRQDQGIGAKPDVITNGQWYVLHVALDTIIQKRVEEIRMRGLEIHGMVYVQRIGSCAIER